MSTRKRTSILARAMVGKRERGMPRPRPDIHFESPLERELTFALLTDFRGVKSRDWPVTTKRANDTAY